ncbi:MAG: COGs COG0840, partial [uncultured Nocardioidaceae bacterium]
VPQHPPAPQLRAARDVGGGAGGRRPVRPQGRRRHPAEPGQRGGVRPRGPGGRGGHPAAARRAGHHRGAQGPRGRGRQGARQGGRPLRL